MAGMRAGNVLRGGVGFHDQQFNYNLAKTTVEL